jgi:hypothetical protein
MKEYVTSAKISASPERVWAVLADGEAYRQWNPEIVGVEGQIDLGASITAQVRLGDGAVRSVPQRVIEFEPPHRMTWVGGLPLGLFVGRRTFIVTPAGDGAEFQMHLRMSGLLSSLILKSVGDRQPEIDKFSAALKSRAEAAGNHGLRAR